MYMMVSLCGYVCELVLTLSRVGYTYVRIIAVCAKRGGHRVAERGVIVYIRSVE